ncbi:MAG: hypothetical protein KGM92_08710, partial [Acidobacteriota bacterium]|nr:hypothetical protein [Acidobacteriota bacterium]
LRHEIQQIDPDLPVYNLWTLAEPLKRNYWFQRIIGTGPSISLLAETLDCRAFRRFAQTPKGSKTVEHTHPPRP